MIDRWANRGWDPGPRFSPGCLSGRAPWGSGTRS